MFLSKLFENKRDMVNEKKAVNQTYTDRCRELHEKYAEYYGEKANDYVETIVNKEIGRGRWTGFFRNRMIVGIPCSSVHDSSDNYACNMLINELEALRPGCFSQAYSDMIETKIAAGKNNGLGRLQAKHPNWKITVVTKNHRSDKRDYYNVVVQKLA